MNSHFPPRSHRTSYIKGLGAMLALSAGALVAQPAHVTLPAPAKGAAAITALGSHLPNVAKAYGLQAQELVTLLQTQPSLGVDMEGALMFTCEAPPADVLGRSADAPGRNKGSGAVEDVMAPNSSVTLLANGTAVDAFKLHSLPGVNRVIYLDFNGHTTSGTSWNTSFASGNPIVSAPFDLDGDPTTFNATERGLIQRIWQRVAEDYAPFAVNVTTEDPGLEALRRTDTNDQTFGMRVVISPTNWYKSTAGGVAYIGSFNANTDTPCFAFSGQLANNEKYMAEAISHEAGHTLGLYHDGVGGTSPTEYYQGHGNWAPIMGVGYYKSVVQFSRGEYANANNTQDDLAVIAKYVPLAGDDHGNTLATATVLFGGTIATGGTIETRSDVDLFRFDTAAGTISLTIKGPAPDSNLDIKAELLNASGQVLQVSNPTTLQATINASVAAGTYYLRIDGVEVGDASTGYTDYGSLGNYVITGTTPATTSKVAPTAVATVSSTSGVAPLTVSFSAQGSYDSDGTITSYQWAFGVSGATATGATASYTYTTPGTYVAMVTVVDNDGLASSKSLTIVANEPANLAPTAIASASVTSGVGPLAVAFSASGSFDSDGKIAAYSWNFGDGTSSTLATPSKTFSTPGDYTVRLTVTDDRGATGTTTLVISVSADPAATFDVKSFVLTTSTAKSGTAVSAAVAVYNQQGLPVAGVEITVVWSGLVTGSTTGITDGNGVVVLTSARTKKSGTVTATIGSASATTSRYSSEMYSEPLVRSIRVN